MSALAQSLSSEPVRRHLRVRGQVQGVGFRPYVYRLATELGLAGWVRNDAEGVEIEVQGSPDAVDRLIDRLPREAPVLARIASLWAEDRPAVDETGSFRIEASGAGAPRAQATPDIGTCPECLAELFDPADRRHRYPFINCTQCGPRYTIVRGLPYDRARTSMAAFAQCPACEAEYCAPEHRRFHAEPNACPACGPRLFMCDGGGAPLAPADVIAETLARLRTGEIVALKGLGGFHLACDARNAEAVARLRQRKQREEKPFAVMLANAASARTLVELDEAERAVLEAPERPIVVARKRADCDAALPGVAPGLAGLGVMLPYTPLHWLLFHEAAGRPAGIEWIEAAHPLALVMTSANPHDEPLVAGNDEALERLAGIADAFVLHDRDIVARCDDSVMRRSGGAPGFQFVRRARGWTPQAIALSRAGPSVLAFGPHLKNTICVTREDQAFVSAHVGDLDNVATCVALDGAVERMLALTETAPRAVAHDLHPDFHSTRQAAQFAADRGLPAFAVQHHHAHIAAVMAEHRLEGEVIGLALDGVGQGEEGGAWGGELLRCSAREFARLGHLRPLHLPGGDKAAREPWRMAAAVLHALGRADEIRTRWPYPAARALPLMLKAGVHAPLTTSCGRWFDAAAGFAAVKDFVSFEGQAAMLYERLAEAHGPVDPMAGGWRAGADGELDLLPLLERLADEPDAVRAAALFHATLAEALADWTVTAARRAGLDRVALGGGCFLNSLLSRGLRARLEANGLTVFEASLVPPNDGGIALGQAWVAMHRMQ